MKVDLSEEANPTCSFNIIYSSLLPLALVLTGTLGTLSIHFLSKCVVKRTYILTPATPHNIVISSLFCRSAPAATGHFETETDRFCYIVRCIVLGAGPLITRFNFVFWRRANVSLFLFQLPHV